MRISILLVIYVGLAFGQDLDDPQLSLMKKDLPRSNVSIEKRLDWLWNCSVRCDQTRKYAEAEAYMSGVLAIAPDDGHALGSMACYIGKQGRYLEALDITNLALTKNKRNLVQLMGIKATWLAHLGKVAEADLIWTDLVVPDAVNKEEYSMYWICRAFFLARIKKDEMGIKAAMGKVLLVSSEVDHWMGFFRNDASFDQFKDKDWFNEMLAR